MNIVMGMEPFKKLARNSENPRSDDLKILAILAKILSFL